MKSSNGKKVAVNAVSDFTDLDSNPPKARENRAAPAHQATLSPLVSNEAPPCRNTAPADGVDYARPNKLARKSRSGGSSYEPVASCPWSGSPVPVSPSSDVGELSIFVVSLCDGIGGGDGDGENLFWLRKRSYL